MQYITHAYHLGKSCISVAIFAVYLLFPPPFSLPIDPDTDAASVIDYVIDDPSFSAELPGKQNPLDHQISPIPFSLMLALELSPSTVPIAPNPMHSLIL